MNMVQIFTLIPEEIIPYMNCEFSKEINNYLIRFVKFNSFEIFNQILIEVSSQVNIQTSKRKMYSLFLDYEAIDIVKTLSYLLKVDDYIIYEWVCKKLIND